MANPHPEPHPENLMAPIKPGEVRNPNGRPTAGASVKEWMNILAAQELTEDELRKIARGKLYTWAKRTAAGRLVRTLESPDLADFEEVMNGETTLKGARDAGLNTEVIKKLKNKTRTTTTKSGDPVVETEREIELYDRAGEDFDRVLDRTEGKAKQINEHTGANGADLFKAFVGIDPEKI